jgi:threonine/homoserine/homoserine lactone efflux protein
LKVAGAFYLLYLAFQVFRAGASNLNGTGNANLTWQKLYCRGIIMNITNPKVAVFFLAFLPQFADSSRGAMEIQMLMFGGLFIGSTLLIFGAVAWFAGFLGEWLKSSAKAQIIMNRVAGTVFVALALRLVVLEP